MSRGAACAVSKESDSPGKQAEERHAIEESNPIELDAPTLDLAAVALADFKAKNKKWRCFEVSIYSDGENWRVDFAPADDVQKQGETLVVGASKCGEGVSYIVSLTGKIVRVIYAR